MMPNEILGLGLGFVVGIVLGLLGGGGSILAVPIFLYVFRVDPKPAIAMSLAVVGMSAFVGFLGHWRQGSVNLRVGFPFGALAMVAAFFTARVSDRVPDVLQPTHGERPTSFHVYLRVRQPAPMGRMIDMIMTKIGH